MLYLEIHGEVGHTQRQEGDDETHRVDQELGAVPLQADGQYYAHVLAGEI